MIARSVGYALLLCAASAAIAETVELGDDLRLEPLSPGIYRHVSSQEMPGWGRVPANGLVVLGESAAALIDTAWTDEQTGLLFDWVAREHGIEIEHVVATHSHADCAGGLAEAHRRGARSYGSTLTAELAGQEGNPVPRTTFEERHTIDLGGTEVELRYLGAGHTRDNIVAWLPQQRLLFGGCLVKRTGAGEGYVEEADLTAWPQTIRALRAAYPDVEVVVPGHGKPGGAGYLDYTEEMFRDR